VYRGDLTINERLTSNVGQAESDANEEDKVKLVVSVI